jgi:hypothetical protein
MRGLLYTGCAVLALAGGFAGGYVGAIVNARALEAARRAQVFKANRREIEWQLAHPLVPARTVSAGVR